MPYRPCFLHRWRIRCLFTGGHKLRIIDGWMNPNFDDSNWPNAFEYLDQEVGIIGVPGYWRYPDAFMGARWIWTVSLVFDNTVLLRKTVR